MTSRVLDTNPSHGTCHKMSTTETCHPGNKTHFLVQLRDQNCPLPWSEQIFDEGKGSQFLQFSLEHCYDERGLDSFIIKRKLKKQMSKYL